MTHQTIHLGQAPIREDHTHISHPDYDRYARRECWAFIEAIRATVGREPDAAKLRVKRENNQRGSFLEVVVNFDPNDRAAREYARRCELYSPDTWEEAGITPPHTSPADGRRYVGERTEDGFEVFVVSKDGAERLLSPRFDLRNHSPSGFEIGYHGSGPAQLSLALLADALGDDNLAEAHYQEFKQKVIAGMKGDRFELTQAQIRDTVAEIEKGQGWKI